MVRRVIEVVIDIEEDNALDLNFCLELCSEVQSNLEDVYPWELNVRSVVMRSETIDVNLTRL